MLSMLHSLPLWLVVVLGIDAQRTLNAVTPQLDDFLNGKVIVHRLLNYNMNARRDPSIHFFWKVSDMCDDDAVL